MTVEKLIDNILAEDMKNGMGYRIPFALRSEDSKIVEPTKLELALLGRVLNYSPENIRYASRIIDELGVKNMSKNIFIIKSRYIPFIKSIRKNYKEGRNYCMECPEEVSGQTRTCKVCKGILKKIKSPVSGE